MRKIKISVIIYVKNTVNYIEKCIRSVMNQTLQEIEILIIDGGSTDGSLDVIEKVKQEDKRIRIFHGPASVGAQFNLGLREAKGEYIGICEADDYILPEMYERQYQIAKENQLDVVRAGYYQTFNLNGEEYRFKLKSCGQDEMVEKVIISDGNTHFLKQGINGFWSGLYRKQFLVEHRIWMNETKGAAYQDITFSFLAQMYAGRIWFMKDAFYCYRIDNPNASVNSLHGIDLHMKEYEELKSRLKNAGRWEEYKNYFFSWELLSYRWLLEELPEDLKKINIEKVYYYLKKQRDNENYNVRKVMDRVKKLAEDLGRCETEFEESILSEIENGRRLEEYIEHVMKYDKTMILFGAGHIGNMVKQFFELSKKEVLLMDNSSLLQKNGLMGKTVYKPENLISRFPEGRYIIANFRHSTEMKEQLIQMGIPEGNIIICDNEEFFLRKIFVKVGQYIENELDS